MDDLKNEAQIAFNLARFDDVLQFCQQILEERPRDSATRLMAGQAAEKLNRFDQAIAFWDGVPREDLEIYAQAQNAAGQSLLFQKFHLSESLKRFMRVFELAPENVTANDHVAFIYGMSGQYLRQVPHRLRLIQQKRFELMHLVSMALGEESLENAEIIESYHQADPRDPLPYITLGRMAQEKQDYKTARPHFETAVELKPDLLAAQVWLGQLHFEQKDWPAFLRWHAGLPSSADGHPGIWILRGDYALEHLGAAPAARCYAEAIRRDPNHSHSNYQLGQIFVSLDHPQRAAAFLERAKNLRKFVNAVKAASFDQNLAKIHEAMELGESLGLFHEAYAWALVLERYAPRGTAWQVSASQIRSRIEPMTGSLSLDRCQPQKNPIQGLDIEQFPLPVFPSASPSDSIVSPDEAEGISTSGQAEIAFEDQAEAAGLKFRYFNGRDSVEKGLKQMYEFAGGGVAVLDYDGDSLPDVFFTQGTRWPPGSNSSEFNDRLFRNRGDGSFEDVTFAAGFREAGFGQGVAVGDFDSDGWPDLFVANIGQNHLYRNNSDGTFTEMAEPAGVAGNRWSTSAALVDLNQDNHPDLYVVNYLGDEDVFTRTCGSGDNLGICLPQSFHAEQDRLYLSLGDGRFQDVTETAGIQVEDGKGLGIVVGDLDGSRQLSVFIANDTTPNFLFTRADSEQPPVKWQFAETAMLRGLAFNREGKTESGMGIAVGDANEDGRLDVFVTNFFGESNTLYQQLSSGVFEDVTLNAGLHHSSLPMVGFGTQFLDADLNGRQDLIVTNGHIDDFRDRETADYQMPPQFYVNRGRGQFHLAEAASLGPYFQRKVLGRALAKVDWNQDGLEDVIITHLDAPAALLTNTTSEPGQCVALQFRGVESQRDGIGVVVRATFCDQTQTRQLTAGDGYFCSNERQIVVGLGESPQIDRLVVDWPSGRQEEFANLSAGSRLLLVEGRGTPYPILPSREP